jgi:activator of HSP90 ATPase
MAVESGRIVQTEYIPAKPLHVYEALTDPLIHSAFTKAQATGEPVVGGRFTAWNGYISGKHVELQPGRRIVQEWRTTMFPQEHPPSRLEITLEGKGEGTTLTMVQTGVPIDQVERYTKGWVRNYWDPLRAYFKQ